MRVRWLFHCEVRIDCKLIEQNVELGGVDLKGTNIDPFNLYL
jgi:hypothetical protein